ncbi:MAG: ATP-binding protein [Cyanobacteria bacterium P01_C01_bin.70]
MFNRHFLDYYSRASITTKISMPFILLFIGCWVTGIVALGQYLMFRLEQKHKVRSEELAALVEREIEKELKYLRLDARLLSIQSDIVQGTATSDATRLRQLILPLKSILDADLIAIVDTAGQPILETRQPTLKDRQLQANTITELLLTGSDLATIAGTSNQGPPVLLGTAPVKTNQGIEGGILIGNVLDDERLEQISRIVDEQLVIILDNGGNGKDQIVASTFPEISPELLWLYDLVDHEAVETAQNRDYLIQEIRFDGSEGQSYYLVILFSKALLNQAKLTTWFVIVAIATLGACLMTLLALRIARVIARPIQDITQIAQQVIQEEDFTLRTTPHSKDEIGTLAEALNQLVQWTGEYTDELEAAARTLESRVEERTQELSDALAALQSTQAQLIQTEKMSSLGQMVAGIAHEVNNPINFIQGNLPYLKEYVEDLRTLLATYQTEYPHPSDAVLEVQEEIDLDFLLKDVENILESLKTGTERVRNIVVSLRNYSRLDEATIKDVDIHEGIDSTLVVLNHRLKKGIEVIKIYGSLPSVRCSPSQLNQVFTNILSNALDAMFDADSQPKQLTIATRVQSDEHIQISFRDTGPGMTPAIKAKIFDPFFTTKTVGKGTGLGMGICFKIIEQHQGTIAVETAVGQGTEFTITLPIESSKLNYQTPPLAPV